MNFNQYTIKSQELIQQAAQIAQGFSQQSIETGHLLKAILEEEPNTSSFLLKKYGISPENFLKKLDPIGGGISKSFWWKSAIFGK